MNPRQRRGVLLLGLAALGAVVVFVLVLNYVGSVQSEVGAKTPVLRLRNDVAVYQAITPEMVDLVQIPKRWQPDSVLTDPAQLVQGVAASNLKAGSFLQQGMLTPPTELQPNQRELAVLIDAETGVAGKIQPRDLVDIYATFNKGPTTGRPTSQIIVTNALVLDVGSTQAAQGANGKSALDQQGKVMPVTFALSVPESQAVVFAQTFAAEIHLALIGRGDHSVVSPKDRVFTGTPAPAAQSGAGTTPRSVAGGGP